MRLATNIARTVVSSLTGSVIILVCGVFPYASSVAADHPAAAMAMIDDKAGWADELTQPKDYIGAARRAVNHKHYDSATHNLRDAAAMVARHGNHSTGRERARLSLAAEALRLTAKDVAAGAVTSAAQLDSILNDTHRDLLAQHPSDR